MYFRLSRALTAPYAVYNIVVEHVCLQESAEYQSVGLYIGLNAYRAKSDWQQL